MTPVTPSEAEGPLFVASNEEDRSLHYASLRSASVGMTGKYQ